MVKLLIISSFVIAALSINAQSLSLSHEGTPLEPSEEITVYGETGPILIAVEIDVTNNSSTEMAVLVKKVENYLVQIFQ